MCELFHFCAIWGGGGGHLKSKSALYRNMVTLLIDSQLSFSEMDV